MGADYLADVYPRYRQFQELRDRLDPTRVLANTFTARVLGI